MTVYEVYYFVALNLMNNKKKEAYIHTIIVRHID